MSKRGGARNTKRAESIGTCAGPVFRDKLASRVTVHEIERVLAELGFHAKLSDIVAKAQSMRNGIIQSPSCRKRERAC